MTDFIGTLGVPLVAFMRCVKLEFTGKDCDDKNKIPRSQSDIWTSQRMLKQLLSHWLLSLVLRGLRISIISLAVGPLLDA